MCLIGRLQRITADVVARLVPQRTTQGITSQGNTRPFDRQDLDVCVSIALNYRSSRGQLGKLILVWGDE